MLRGLQPSKMRHGEKHELMKKKKKKKSVMQTRSRGREKARARGKARKRERENMDKKCPIKTLWFISQVYERHRRL